MCRQILLVPAVTRLLLGGSGHGCIFDVVLDWSCYVSSFVPVDVGLIGAISFFTACRRQTWASGRAGSSSTLLVQVDAAIACGKWCHIGAIGCATFLPMPSFTACRRHSRAQERRGDAQPEVGTAEDILGRGGVGTTSADPCQWLCIVPSSCVSLMLVACDEAVCGQAAVGDVGLNLPVHRDGCSDDRRDTDAVMYPGTSNCLWSFNSGMSACVPSPSSLLCARAARR